jgi:hypothetical protein
MDFTFLDPRVRATARLIHSLSEDLRALQQGRDPTVEQLANAPTLVDWTLGTRIEPALIGKVIGHPHLANGPVQTSGLYYLDTKRGFARTLSRWYVLGVPSHFELSISTSREVH